MRWRDEHRMTAQHHRMGRRSERRHRFTDAESRKTRHVARQLIWKKADEIPDLVEPPSLGIADRTGARMQILECEAAVLEVCHVHVRANPNRRELTAVAPQAARRG